MKIIKVKNILFVSFVLSILFACSTTNIKVVDENSSYLPSDNVKIFNTFPAEPYKVIAQIDIKGEEGSVAFDLVRQMREKAMKLGADAIIPLKENPEFILPGQSFDPWINKDPELTNNGEVLVVSGLAIKFTIK